MEFFNLFYFYSKYISRVRTYLQKKQQHKTYLLNLYEKKNMWMDKFSSGFKVCHYYCHLNRRTVQNVYGFYF